MKKGKLSREELTPELIAELLEYDKETGELYWKIRTLEHFAHCKDPRKALHSFNSCFACTPAFQGYAKSSFHQQSTIMSKNFQRSQVCWILGHGEYPSGYIGYIDGDCNNHALCNLYIKGTNV